MEKMMSNDDSSADIAGILVHGLTSMLSSREWRELTADELSADGPRGVDPDKDIVRVQSVSSDPVYFMAELIDQLIVDGSLRAGSFNGLTCDPPKEAWPERWKGLQLD